MRMNGAKYSLDARWDSSPKPSLKRLGSAGLSGQRGHGGLVSEDFLLDSAKNGQASGFRYLDIGTTSAIDTVVSTLDNHWPSPESFP